MAMLEIQPNLEHDTNHGPSTAPESWTDIKDSNARRRMQNRVNQRACRKRKATAKGDDSGIIIKQWKAPSTSKAPQTQLPPPTTESNTAPETEACFFGPLLLSIDETPNIFTELATEVTTIDDTLPALPAKPSHIHSLTTQDSISLHTIEAIRTSYKKYLASHHQHPSQSKRPGPRPRLTQFTHPPSTLTLPADDRLLSLLYYNTCRGLIHNIALLGLSGQKMSECDYPSPFTPLSPTATSAIANLPPNMQPTILQRMVDHHPFLDVFPCRAVRDNALRYDWTDWEEEALCWDVVGLSLSDDDGQGEGGGAEDDEGRTGASVWGEPWRVESWEVSAFLARRWGFLFRGSWELERATNARRRARGWKDIYFA